MPSRWLPQVATRSDRTLSMNVQQGARQPACSAHGRRHLDISAAASHLEPHVHVAVRQGLRGEAEERAGFQQALRRCNAQAAALERRHEIQVVGHGVEVVAGIAAPPPCARSRKFPSRRHPHDATDVMQHVACISSLQPASALPIASGVKPAGKLLRQPDALRRLCSFAIVLLAVAGARTLRLNVVTTKGRFHDRPAPTLWGCSMAQAPRARVPSWPSKACPAQGCRVGTEGSSKNRASTKGDPFQAIMLDRYSAKNARHSDRGPAARSSVSTCEHVRRRSPLVENLSSIFTQHAESPGRTSQLTMMSDNASRRHHRPMHSTAGLRIM